MIQVRTDTAQTLQPGQALNFDSTTILHTGCGECFNRQIPTSVKLRGGCGSVYEIEFEGNVGAEAAATAVQLSLAIAGSPLTDTVMNATPTAVGDLVNVSTGTFFQVCCGDINRISVVNTGTNPIIVAAGASLRIARRG